VSQRALYAECRYAECRGSFWKGLPVTNTLAYWSSSSLTGKESLITLTESGRKSFLLQGRALPHRLLQAQQGQRAARTSDRTSGRQKVILPAVKAETEVKVFVVVIFVSIASHNFQ
jgi:hypothetical protein